MTIELKSTALAVNITHCTGSFGVWVVSKVTFNKDTRVRVLIDV